MPAAARTSPASTPPNVAADGGEEMRVRTPGRAGTTFDFPSSAPFVYLANPRHYDVFDVDGEGTYEILPALREYHMEPGVGGVREVEEVDDDGVKRIHADATHSLARLTQQGWIEVPLGGEWKVTAFGQTFPNYVHTYKVRRGTAHLPRWVRLYSLGGQVETERDPAGFAEFQRRIAAELLPPLDANIRKGLEARLKTMQSAIKRRNPHAGEADTAAGQLAGKLKVLATAKKPKGAKADAPAVP